MNYRIETIEILENGEFIGYTPLVKWEGKNKRGYIKDGKPVLFDTRKKARIFAVKQECTFETSEK